MSDKNDKPSFYGNMMPVNVNKSFEDGDEVTRKIAAPNRAAPNFAGPAMIQPFTGTDSSVPAFQQKQQVTAQAESTPSFNLWKVDTVPTLPEFYPLERYAVFVEDAAPAVISERISKALQARSIEAEYSSEDAKVSCVNSDGVDFRIKLYRGRGEYSHGIIIEVQRRFGTSQHFFSDIKAILDAAEGKVTPASPNEANGIPLPTEIEDSDEEEISGTTSLLMVSKMLQHPGIDSHNLALQTLISLTDPGKMGAKTAKAVSTHLLEVEQGNEVGSRVLGIILDKETDESYKLRSSAMIVLSNAICTMEGKISNSLREHIRPTFIKVLENAESRPRDAYAVAKCVEWLLDFDENKADFYEPLEKAQKIGSALHAKLESQASVCLKKY